jgi:hypothetical protein
LKGSFCCHFVILDTQDQNKRRRHKSRRNCSQIQCTRNHYKIRCRKRQHKSMNFFDSAVHRKSTTSKFAIFRKPTRTDTLVPNGLCYPYEHKVKVKVKVK